MGYALTVLFGLLPSLLFFAWVERNCALPWVGAELGWPWLPADFAMPTLLWDALLIQAFGVVHTYCAQARLRTRISRPLYICITGVSLFGVMTFWMPTGQVLWAPRLPWWLLQTLSLALYWGLMAGALWMVSRHGLAEFLGLAPGATRTPVAPTAAPLRTTGLYALSRHPMYSFTLLAFAITPFLTLDRLIVVLSTAAYLAWAVPIEERKLRAEFGPAYDDYRRRVPAVVPRLWRKPGRFGSVNGK